VSNTSNSHQTALILPRAMKQLPVPRDRKRWLRRRQWLLHVADTREGGRAWRQARDEKECAAGLRAQPPEGANYPRCATRWRSKRPRRPAMTESVAFHHGCRRATAATQTVMQLKLLLLQMVQVSCAAIASAVVVRTGVESAVCRGAREVVSSEDASAHRQGGQVVSANVLDAQEPGLHLCSSSSPQGSLLHPLHCQPQLQGCAVVFVLCIPLEPLCCR
jgi:hypothetical protein